ncbi:MAG: 4-hydroxythreonine-4-phosphate dehydrogenase PdxA [Lentimicrobiaceae bacterium]|jgi:4-hydroxythreonine-4-phosphate dehydrogenase
MIRTSDNENRIAVGITHGDINSISYEVIIKTCVDQRITELFTPIVYGTSKAASYHRKMLNIPDFSFNIIRSADQASPKKANLINLTDKEVKIDIGESTITAGEMSLLSINAAVEDLKKGLIDVLVTAPVNKHNVQDAAQKPFTGHTGYLAEKFGVSNYLMLMVGDNLRIGVVTEHIALDMVSKTITSALIQDKINILEESLRKDFNIRKPRIAILGLNPHAGDGGLIGNEEQEIITPAILTAQQKGLLVYGPYPADGFFASSGYKQFDAVLAMYHDQGLIPFKTLNFEEGVNFTAGLPYVRTSPAHGTAYDIAGKDQASSESMHAATYLACEIFKNRMQWAELNENPLGFSKKEKE